MTPSPAFFVPTVRPGTDEAFFQELATMARAIAPQLEDRIFSITWENNGEEWTGTVGETMSGTRPKTSRSKGKKVERVETLYDPATVLAIFPGSTYLIVTNQGIPTSVRSAFVNPFFVGQPKSITRFGG